VASGFSSTLRSNSSSSTMAAYGRHGDGPTAGDAAAVLRSCGPAVPAVDGPTAGDAAAVLQSLRSTAAAARKFGVDHEER
jgi:hypothetical protein